MLAGVRVFGFDDEGEGPDGFQERRLQRRQRLLQLRGTRLRLPVAATASLASR
jgi:hypothetical protein